MPLTQRKRSRGEFEFLARVRDAVEKLGRKPGVLVGIGDDCAVVAGDPASSSARRRGNLGPSAKVGGSLSHPLVLTTDTMVEGAHYRAGWLTARELGARAFRVAVSDVAAMGARPHYVLLSLELPPPSSVAEEKFALDLVRAVAAEAKGCGAALVGGNVSAAATTNVTITVVGQSAGRPLLRSGAKPGDLVFQTGKLGGAAAGWRLLAENAKQRATLPQAGLRPATLAYRRPPSRLEFAAALAESDLATTMIDVSDGLIQDLGHIAEASAVNIVVDETSVPIHGAAKRYADVGCSPGGRKKQRGSTVRPSALELALTGGEDYELVFTASAASVSAINELAARTRTPVAVIGRVQRGRAVVVDHEGKAFKLRTAGFDHLVGSRGKKR